MIFVVIRNGQLNTKYNPNYIFSSGQPLPLCSPGQDDGPGVQSNADRGPDPRGLPRVQCPRQPDPAPGPRVSSSVANHNPMCYH